MLSSNLTNSKINSWFNILLFFWIFVLDSIVCLVGRGFGSLVDWFVDNIHPSGYKVAI